MEHENHDSLSSKHVWVYLPTSQEVTIVDAHIAISVLKHSNFCVNAGHAYVKPLGRQQCIALHSLTSHLPETVQPIADLKFLCLRCELPAIQLAISAFLCTPQPQCLACSLQTDSFYMASVCSLPEGEEEEQQQRGGRREGWENKASIVVSPAGPGRAALAGASYVMWLAGPTFLFRAAAHTNPHWGTSPALEEEEEISEELWGNQWRKCD